MLVNSGLQVLRQLIDLSIFRIAGKTLFDLLSLTFPNQPNQTTHLHFKCSVETNQTILLLSLQEIKKNIFLNLFTKYLGNIQIELW